MGNIGAQLGDMARRAAEDAAARGICPMCGGTREISRMRDTGFTRHSRNQTPAAQWVNERDGYGPYEKFYCPVCVQGCYHTVGSAWRETKGCSKVKAQSHWADVSEESLQRVINTCRNTYAGYLRRLPCPGTPEPAGLHEFMNGRCRHCLWIPANYHLPTLHQYVVFTRHAQSRWNEAQDNWDLLGMQGQSDHPLSGNGHSDAVALCDQIGRLRALPEEVFQRDPQAGWNARLLRPNVVYCSPLTRAMETAVIAYKPVLAELRTLKVMKEAREQKNFGGADCTGVAFGNGSIARVRQVMRGRGEAFERWAMAALQEFQIDVSDIREPWWDAAVEVQAAVDERIVAFLQKLRCHGSGSTSVVVGHSELFRSIFRQYITDPVIPGSPAHWVREHKIPNCGTVGFRLEWGPQGAKIKDVTPLLGTVMH